MKQFNLEEYLKNPDRKVVTRDGKSVRIVCTDFNNESFPIIGEVQGVKEPETFTKEGLFYLCKYKDSHDLFFAPEKHEGWINIYKNDVGYFGKQIYQKKEDAEMTACSNRIAIAKVEWEE